MKLLYFIIGIILFLAGVGLGVYVGFWLMLVGGVMEIVDAVKAPVTLASEIGWGIIKIMLASASAALTFSFCSFVASAFLAAAVD